MGTFKALCHIYSMNTSGDSRTNVNNLWITLIKNKGYEMKFKRYNNPELTYLLWERTDDANIIITKMRGTKTYKLEDLATDEFYIFNNLQDAKDIGAKIWLGAGNID